MWPRVSGIASWSLIPTTRLQARQTLNELRSLAEQGDAGAQVALGWKYFDGEGVPQDDAVAGRWFRLAAAQGDADAQFYLGFMYAAGRGIEQDDAEAIHWYRLAAEQGHASGQFNLGYMYEKGRGVSQDATEAVRWYRLAAEQNDAGAQGNLGIMISTGQGVPEDHVEGHMWLNLAAAQSSGEDRKRLVGARDAVAKVMIAKEIAEAQRRAGEWTPLSWFDRWRREHPQEPTPEP